MNKEQRLHMLCQADVLDQITKEYDFPMCALDQELERMIFFCENGLPRGELMFEPRYGGYVFELFEGKLKESNE